MNVKIKEHYQNLITNNIADLKTATIRSSLEDYKKNLTAETAKLQTEADRNHNLSVLDSFYQESIATLEESEDEMNSCMQSTIEGINILNENEIAVLIRSQLMTSLENFALKETYTSFNGLLFEYSDTPHFTGVAFKEPSFEVILEQAKYLKFTDGTYASDFSLDFQLEEIMEPVLSEEFEETAWAFEFELDIFHKIKDSVYAKIALALHEALSSELIKNALMQKGFETNGVVYFNEHDEEVKTVYVNAWFFV